MVLDEGKVKKEKIMVLDKSRKTKIIWCWMKSEKKENNGFRI
jgi:hypothetical protein